MRTWLFLFFSGAAALATGLMLVILSCVTVRPKKFPGKSPLSRCQQAFFFFFFPFECDSAQSWKIFWSFFIIIKWIFLERGDSRVPQQRSRVDQKMGLWVLISVLSSPAKWLQASSVIPWPQWLSLQSAMPFGGGRRKQLLCACWSPCSCSAAACLTSPCGLGDCAGTSQVLPAPATIVLAVPRNVQLAPRCLLRY